MASRADHALADAAEHAHGVFSRSEARSLGLSDRQIRYRVATGRLIEVHPGVVRLRGWPTTWQSETRAAVLATDGVASHWSAAALWQLHGARPGSRPEVAVRRGRTTVLPGVRQHETTQFVGIDPVEIEGIRCTDIHRTLLDIAHRVELARFVLFVDDARRRDLVDWRSLLRYYRRFGRRGRNGSAHLRALLDAHFGSQALPDSGFNREVGQRLIDAGLPRPVFEYTVVFPDRSTARYDLAWPELRVAVELHSATWHLTRSALSNDARKITDAIRLGWQVLPFTWDQWRASPVTVICAIDDVLRERALAGTAA